MLLCTADSIGDVDKVYLDPNWIPGKSRIYITGTTKEGKKFSLELEVDEEEVSDDRN
jgi:hypothetical protein